MMIDAIVDPASDVAGRNSVLITDEDRNQLGSTNIAESSAGTSATKAKENHGRKLDIVG